MVYYFILEYVALHYIISDNWFGFVCQSITANLRTKILDFKGFDSSILDIKLKGWNSHVHAEFPQSSESTNLSRDDLSREVRRQLHSCRSAAWMSSLCGVAFFLLKVWKLQDSNQASLRVFVYQCSGLLVGSGTHSSVGRRIGSQMQEVWGSNPRLGGLIDTCIFRYS